MNIQDLKHAIEKNDIKCFRKKNYEKIQPHLNKLFNAEYKRCKFRSDLLSYAATMGRHRIVKRIIALDPKMPKPQSYASVPLHRAAGFGHKKVVRYLLKTFPELHKSNYVATALHCAIKHEQSKCANVLINYAKNLNAKKNDVTLLYMAAAHGETSVVKKLIKKGAKIDQTCEFDQTPLQAAIRECHVRTATLLIKKGAQINIQNEFGATPLYIAAQNGQARIAKLLIENNAKVDEPRHDGFTPLYAASMLGHLDVIKLLVENGAKIITKRLNCVSAAHTFGHVHLRNFLIYTVVRDPKCDKLDAAVQLKEIPNQILLECKREIKKADASSVDIFKGLSGIFPDEIIYRIVQLSHGASAPSVSEFKRLTSDATTAVLFKYHQEPSSNSDPLKTHVDGGMNNKPLA